MSVKKLISAIIAMAFVAGAGHAVADTTPYQIDPSHSGVQFAVKHMVVTNVKGDFGEFAGTIHFNQKDVTKSAVEVTIQAASIDTGNEKRDNHLRSPDFLAVEQFPTITFKSTSVKKADNGFVAVGDLTIRGVTKTVEIPFEVAGPLKNPWGQEVIGATGALTINRMDFGAKWNKALEAGGVLVSEDVRIELNVEATPAEG